MDTTSPHSLGYASRYGCQFVDRMGFGREGTVFKTDRLTAVKLFNDARPFRREYEVYQVLSELDIQSIAGHNVPQFVRADTELLAIEMSIVTPPFVLDFAGARTEYEAARFDFEEHVIEEHHARLQDLYGDNWHHVLTVADEFARRTGFELMDIKPGNISF